MRVGKVIVSDLLGRGNRWFKAGDTVTENNFAHGKYDQLVKGGFIRDEPVAAELTEEPKAERQADFELPTGVEITPVPEPEQETEESKENENTGRRRRRR